MQFSHSAFVRTEIPVGENAIKSLIFRLAELLLAITIWKAFSLLAAAQNRFTSYLVFAENPLQKAYFVWSRGISKDGLLVAAFSIMYTAAQLYGTLLWALDAPGHVVQTRFAPASSVSASLLENPAYIVDYIVSPSTVNIADEDLAAALSVNLFQRGTNITLTGSMDHGTPEVVPASSTRPPGLPAGPRIWLDDKGWSVSTDMMFHTASHYGGSDDFDRSFFCNFGDLARPASMPGFDLMRYYNCTFDNEWTPDMLKQPVGTPQVYWTEAAEVEDIVIGSIAPQNHDPWSYKGTSSGTNIRVHMFTVTKGYRRHTFLSTVAKSSVTARGAGVVPQDEMEKLMWRFVEPAVPMADQAIEKQGHHLVAETFMGAQSINKSAAVGITRSDKHHILEGFFEILSFDGLPGETLASVFRVTSVNITLVRSETLSTPPPVPLEACEGAYQNYAQGGKVRNTACHPIPRLHDDSKDFGQVDTSAVLHLDGFHRVPLTSTEAAIDPLLWAWLFNNTEKLSRLVLSRGYLLGQDPKMVTVQIATAVPGISYLQIFMVLLAAVLAAVSSAGLWFFASGHWASSLLVNLLAITCTGFSSKGDVPLICRYPDIHLEKDGGAVKLKTDTGVFAHLDDVNTSKVGV